MNRSWHSHVRIGIGIGSQGRHNDPSSSSAVRERRPAWSNTRDGRFAAQLAFASSTYLLAH